MLKMISNLFDDIWIGVALGSAALGAMFWFIAPLCGSCDAVGYGAVPGLCLMLKWICCRIS